MKLDLESNFSLICSLSYMYQEKLTEQTIMYIRTQGKKCHFKIPRILAKHKMLKVFLGFTFCCYFRMHLIISYSKILWNKLGMKGVKK